VHARACACDSKTPWDTQAGLAEDQLVWFVLDAAAIDLGAFYAEYWDDGWVERRSTRDDGRALVVPLRGGRTLFAPDRAALQKVVNTDAASSLREGLSDTLTVTRLGVAGNRSRQSRAPTQSNR
jgi:hypothetical protein